MNCIFCVSVPTSSHNRVIVFMYGMYIYIHNKTVLELSFLFPTAQFAFMIRDKADIITSMERIEWYKDYITTSKFYKAYVDHCYDYINLLQFTLPKHRWFNIYYDSLVDDPLFVKDRADFTTKQHLPNKPNGPKTWRNDEYLRST